MIAAAKAMSWKKRWMFRVILLAITYAAVEGISYLAMYWLYGSLGFVHKKLSESGSSDSLRAGLSPPVDVIHPFLGYVRRPTSPEREQELRANGTFVNDYGYVGEQPPFHKRAPDTVIVGLLGGSLAEEFCNFGLPTLERELVKSPAFAGKKIIFVRMALSGYKQPQQLMTVNYLLTLGAEFDVLINIDGYNEIALTAVENVPNAVFDAYPRQWRTRVTPAGDMVALRLVGRIAYVQSLRHRMAAFFSRRPQSLSVTATLLGIGINSTLQDAVHHDASLLNSLYMSEHHPAASGPRQKFRDDREMYEHCASVWQRASLHLHQLCAENGIRYYHFLQPNQYVPDSKQFSKEEAAYAIGHHIGAPHVRQGYPLLQQAGAELTRQNVRFHDLTRLFVNHPEPTYRDGCCHLNERGNEILSVEVARILREAQ